MHLVSFTWAGGYREEGDSGKWRTEACQWRRPSWGGQDEKDFRGALREEGEGVGKRGEWEDQEREMACRSLLPHSSWNFFVPLVIEE